MDRRQFLKLGLAGSALVLTSLIAGRKYVYAMPVPGGTIDATAIAKFAQPLSIPGAMPLKGTKRVDGKTVDYYEIAVRQFSQQILPAGLPATTVWGYGAPYAPDSFSYPARTIEARYNRPVQVKWINDLKDAQGNFLPHLLPVDPTLHWANPAGPIDAHGAPQPGGPLPYNGPVPMVTHVHGAAGIGDESDGYPEAWFLPDAADIPAGYARQGTWYGPFRQKAKARYGATWEPGSATSQYPNRQNATTLWYHDHTLGLTRLNVYAGPSGFYLIRGGPGDDISGDLPGPAPKAGDAPGKIYREIPIAIQDRSFNADGSLFFPDTRAFFDGFEGPYLPDADSDIHPIWAPEFFGNTIVVNGRAWPYLEVEPHRYRLRLLNGCNARFLLLKLSDGRPITQIGADQGFLPSPISLQQLLLGPGERADVIVDFNGLPAGTTVTLLNLGPDEPYGGGQPDEDFDQADPETTGLVMQFRIVRPKNRTDESTALSRLRLPRRRRLGPASLTRYVSLNEVGSDKLRDADGEPIGPRQALCGSLTADGVGLPLTWSDPVSENPQPNTTEIWAICNFTEDAHPIHVHDVAFEIVSREPIGNSDPALVRGPEPGEAGLKDTVVAYPGELTKIKMRFSNSGLYTWHCHIIDHEDNEMMRPYVIGPIPQLLADRSAPSNISPESAGFFCIVN